MLEGLQFFGHHGDSEAERSVGGRVDVDVEVLCDLSRAGRTDTLADTVNYVTCYRAVRRVVEEGSHHLLERVAARVADELLVIDERIEGVRVRVAKQPPLSGAFRRFAVVIERSRRDPG